MFEYKAIYIGTMSHSAYAPSSLNDGDNYFTYGWAGKCARKFKEYNPYAIVECWKVDYTIRKIHEKLISGVIFKIIPGYHLKFLGDFSPQLLKLIKSASEQSNKVIFNLSCFRSLLFYSVALSARNFPLVVQHHGEATASYKAKVSKGIKRLFFLIQVPFEKIAFKNIDLFYYIDKRLLEYLPVDEIRTDFKMQTVGVEIGDFPQIDKQEARRLLSLDQDKKYILYIGRLSYAKGIDILLDIFMELKTERQDVELIVGGADHEDPLYQLAVDIGAKVYGIIMHTEIYKYLTAADIYVLPKYSEIDPFGGIGLLPLEALLCETPVVGGSLHNFQEDERINVGFAVSEHQHIKEAILQIIDGKTDFSDLRARASKYYAWENIALKTHCDYEMLLDNYRR